MTKKLILVVDDDQALRDAYQFALSEVYEVAVAEDGVVGLEKYTAHKPDMVFLDLRMPRLDGIGLLRAIRATDTQTPIYVVTAFAKEYMAELVKVRNDGLNFEVASKPLNLQQILTIANSVLQ